MTNPVSDEIHQLTAAAIEAGEDIVPVAIYPFRMSDVNMAAHEASPWIAFWNNLKEGYDLFERTRLPPEIVGCSGRYIFSEQGSGQIAGPLEACQPTLTAIREQDDWLNNVPRPTRELPKLAAQPAAPLPIPQIQSSLESSNTPAPMFSWPLVR
jgi:murein L,D-transpeptidase YafK